MLQSARRALSTALALAALAVRIEPALAAPAVSPPPAPMAPPPLPDAASPGLGVRDALERARRDSLPLAAARMDVSAARADVVAAGVWPNPTVSFNGLFQLHGAITGGRQELTVGLAQVVPLTGAIGLRKDAASAAANAQERELEGFAWQLAQDTRAAYLELQVAEERWRILAVALADLDRMVAIVEMRAASGADPAFDRTRIAVERANLAARLAHAEGDLRAARALLALAVGPSVDGRTLATADALAEPPEQAPSVDDVVARAQAQRPEIAAATLRAGALAARTRYLRRSYVPEPAIGVGYTQYLNVPETPDSGGSLIVGLSLPIPILDHGQGTIERGVAETRAAEIRTKAVQLAIKREAERASLTLAARLAAWRAYREKGLSQLEPMRASAELAYKEGRFSVQQLLDAHTAVREARELALEVRVGALRAVLDVERALGPAR
jgi:cobalt-zinc-cadmium efflux system outer membrane protein